MALLYLHNYTNKIYGFSDYPEEFKDFHNEFKYGHNDFLEIDYIGKFYVNYFSTDIYQIKCC